DCAARRQLLHQRVGCQEVRDCHGATVIVSKHWQLWGAAPRNDVSRHQNQEMRIKKLSIFKHSTKSIHENQHRSSVIGHPTTTSVSGLPSSLFNMTNFNNRLTYNFPTAI